MKDITFENLTICQQCSIVFDYKLRAEKKYGSWYTNCPLCKHCYELPPTLNN